MYIELNTHAFECIYLLLHIILLYWGTTTESLVTHTETVHHSNGRLTLHLVRLLSRHLQTFSLHGCFNTPKSSCATLKHI